MPDTILYDTAMRLFGDLVTPEALSQVEAGIWPAALWHAVEQAGYPDVLAEGPSGMVEAAAILRAAGHHAAPIPIAETMLARWLCAAAGLTPPAGPLTVAPVEPDDALTARGETVSGTARQVPWASQAAGIVLVAGDRVLVAAPGAFACERGVNLAGEPRDTIELTSAGTMPVEGGSAPLPPGAGERLLGRLGALARAAQMAGAMEAALALSVRYANDRVQFGRPIGKFQAIQQQLALLAEQAAASVVVVECAARAVAEDRPSAALGVAAAKIRAGEAAGKVTDIAHQVHGAIGFTDEHSLHRLTRRLWSWRDEFGTESLWSLELGREIARAGADALWPMLTAF